MAGVQGARLELRRIGDAHDRAHLVPPGTPSWVDLGSFEAAAAGAFYGGLFGWNAEMDPRPEAGGYGMFILRSKSVAGLGPLETDARL